jgi:hypothetical protein
VLLLLVLLVLLVLVLTLAPATESLAFAATSWTESGAGDARAGGGVRDAWRDAAAVGPLCADAGSKYLWGVCVPRGMVGACSPSAAASAARWWCCLSGVGTPNGAQSIMPSIETFSPPVSSAANARARCWICGDFAAVTPASNRCNC